MVDVVRLLTRFELFFGIGSAGSMILGARDEASETGASSYCRVFWAGARVGLRVGMFAPLLAVRRRRWTMI